MKTSTLEPYVTPQQVTEYFSISSRTLSRWVVAGCPNIVAGVKSNRRRFKLSHVDQWLESQRSIANR